MFDIVKARAKRLADDFKVKFCSNITDLLNDKDITMVSIVTPSPTHFSLAKTFLQAEKDVLVEKPLALSSKESWELVHLSKRLDCILLTGHLFRFHNALIELKKVIQRGDLGDVIQIIIERSSFGIPREDMGVLHALAIHDVDIPCYLLDEKYPKEIGAFSRSYYRRYPDEIAFVYQKFRRDAVALSQESWLNPIDGKVRRLLLIGSRGAAHINFLVPDTLKIIDSYIANYDGEDLRLINEGERTLRLDPTEALTNEISHFVDCSLKGINTVEASDIGARAVEMVEIAFKSLEEKRTINVASYFENQTSQ